MTHLQVLQDILKSAASRCNGERGLIAFPEDDTKIGKRVQYQALQELAQRNARSLRLISGFAEYSVMLLHFNDNLDNIIWFWSVLYAGCIPAISTPFSLDRKQRQNHVAHLYTMLKDPLCLTRSQLLEEFMGQNLLRTHIVDSIVHSDYDDSKTVSVELARSNPNDVALLMLTSGSTGSAKAVSLKHRQIVASVAGKASIRRLPEHSSFLNWIGLDHVASMIEIHLQAIYRCMDQVHVQASNVIANPSLFLTLAERHHVSSTFAPNFFLAKLKQELESNIRNGVKLDLSSLCSLVSGGEANPLETCIAVSELVHTYGAPKDVIVPGFGMTEICAGATYNRDCPAYDVQKDLEFTSLGTCMPGIKVRVRVYPEHSAQPRAAMVNEVGNLEVSGPIVFDEYFNNKTATRDAFTADDRWFQSGDQAFIDSSGMLNLAGRAGPKKR